MNNIRKPCDLRSALARHYQNRSASKSIQRASAGALLSRGIFHHCRISQSASSCLERFSWDHHYGKEETSEGHDKRGTSETCFPPEGFESGKGACRAAECT